MKLRALDLFALRPPVLRGALSWFDRTVAVVLAIVFLVAGVAGVTLGIIRLHLALLVVSVLVAAWGVAWAAVGWRGRLLRPPQRERARGQRRR